MKLFAILLVATFKRKGAGAVASAIGGISMQHKPR